MRKNMTAKTDIKFFVSTNLNIPQLSNNYGDMIDILDACLVNGFGSQIVSSLTANKNLVTATFNSAHKLSLYQVIKISGANENEFNGEHRVLSIPDQNTITFEINSTSVNVATGIIDCSIPSLGWLKPFQGAGKAAYRSGNQNLIQRPFLRVVDALDPSYNSSYAKYAKVGIVEQMIDIDNFTGVQSPFDAANSKKNWVGSGSGGSAINGWARWYFSYASGTNGTAISNPNANDTSPATNGSRLWYLVGDSDAFILAIRLGITDSHSFSVYGFGKYKSFFDADVFNDFLASHLFYQQANWVASDRASYAGLVNNRINDTLCLSRKLDNSAENSYGKITVNSLSTSGQSNVTQSATTIGQLIYSPVDIWTESVFRGRLPFLRWSYQAKPVQNLSQFIDGNEIFLALDTEFGSRESGQIFVKIGDL